MPRFVLLHHEMPEFSNRASHFDLMLEVDDRLLTWALPKIPQDQQAMKVLKLADHRLDYLQYEGAISADRGTVRRVDQGSYSQIDQSNLEQTNQRKLYLLEGNRLQGKITLEEVNLKNSQWLLLYKAV